LQILISFHITFYFSKTAFRPTNILAKIYDYVADAYRMNKKCWIL